MGRGMDCRCWEVMLVDRKGSSLQQARSRTKSSLMQEPRGRVSRTIEGPGVAIALMGSGLTSRSHQAKNFEAAERVICVEGYIEDNGIPIRKVVSRIWSGRGT